MSKTIELVIEENGDIKIETGDMSGVGHYSAGEYLKTVKKETGGVVKTEKIKRHHTHARQTNPIKR